MSDHYEMKIGDLKEEIDFLNASNRLLKKRIEDLNTDIRRKDFTLNMALETMNEAIRNIEKVHEYVGRNEA